MSARRGGKNKRKGKNHFTPRTRELRERDADQEYGWVTKMLGDRRVECLCSDGETRKCHIRGSMRRRVWISVGDVVLVALREFEDAKGDIIHKYNPTEAEHMRQSEMFDPQRIQRGAAVVIDKDLYATGIQEGAVIPAQEADADAPLEIDFSLI